MLTTLIVAMITGAGGTLVSGEVTLVAEGFQFTEGPVWLPGGPLIFSDIPADRIYRADKAVFREPSGQSNGLTLDRAGRLIAAEHQNRRISRTEADGTVTVAADRYEGKRFNSPNDVVVDAQGRVYFTDPTYGLEGREAELAFSGVYMIDPDGTVQLLSREFSAPNGLAFSPDGKLLYIADSQESLVRVYPVGPDGLLGEGRLFCEVPGPDGMKTDVNGRLWIASADGVAVFDSDGSRVGVIAFPEQPSNCAFGGPDGKTLYVTARTSLYSVPTAVAGTLPGPAAAGDAER